MIKTIKQEVIEFFGIVKEKAIILVQNLIASALKIPLFRTLVTYKCIIHEEK